MTPLALAESLAKHHDLEDGELLDLLTHRDPEVSAYLKDQAQQTALSRYGNQVFIRGLIEFTNYCKNDCYYCGIRRSNRNAQRYRLIKEDILACCGLGYHLGFRTFVLQGGEDPWFTDDRLVEIVGEIKAQHPDCAVTLSVGERSRESYRRLKEAGADRYLLRHETATPSHYAKLHPLELTLSHRMKCLSILKELGYQVGAGFMVGSPYQTLEDLVRDLRFLKEFQPHMVGIGPFLSQHDTPFREFPNGSGELTLFLLSVIRLLLPGVLLPATTALGTLLPNGREEGILHGANVVMPNLSPQDARTKYTLYDNKLHSGAEAAESLALLRESLEKIGYEIPVSRGDSLIC
jgi:biotin synthase